MVTPRLARIRLLHLLGLICVGDTGTDWHGCTVMHDGELGGLQKDGIFLAIGNRGQLWISEVFRPAPDEPLSMNTWTFDGQNVAWEDDRGSPPLHWEATNEELTKVLAAVMTAFEGAYPCGVALAALTAVMVETFEWPLPLFGEGWEW